MKEPKQQHTDVIQFFEYDDAELQSRIESAEREYFVRTEGLVYKGCAANIEFKRYGALADTLEELYALLSRGYSVCRDRYASAHGLDFEVTLRKPDDVIKSDLDAIHAQAEQLYRADLLARNLAEEQRQLSISMDRIARDAEKARLAAEQAAAEKLRAKALQELREAYAA
ncbi:hypothetical protein [Metapseudomonas furukawaii]